jgi:heptosyltransferase-1
MSVRVLLVKTSSMGDLVHTLPAITDASRHGVEFDWVVEEAFTAIADRHPAVNEVLPVGWRRWRRNLLASRGELTEFFTRLRQRRYDLVLDAQGLWKSAALALAARTTKRCGFDRESAREGASTAFFQHKFNVPQGMHAIDRQRQLFSKVFEYPLTDSPEIFGIEADPSASERICVLTHGTTWATKHWPEPMWIVLSRELGERGYQVVLPAGNDVEAQRAARIADASQAQVLTRSSLAELIDKIANVALIVGVDSGLSHLAAALGRPTVTLYGATDPALTGARGQRAVSLQAQFDCAPCRNKVCGYRGEAQHWQQQRVQPACFSTLTPDHVLQAVEAL